MIDKNNVQNPMVDSMRAQPNPQIQQPLNQTKPLTQIQPQLQPSDQSNAAHPNPQAQPIQQSQFQPQPQPQSKPSSKINLSIPKIDDNQPKKSESKILSKIPLDQSQPQQSNSSIGSDIQSKKSQSQQLSNQQKEQSLRSEIQYDENRSDQSQYAQHPKGYNGSYGQFINQLKMEEEREKKQQDQAQRMEKYGTDNVELTKGEFIYMMEKFKEDVVKDLKQKEDEAQSSQFLQQQLYRYGSLQQSYQNNVGDQNYNVRLTPEQLTEMLDQYQRFQEKQIRDTQDAKIDQKEQLRQYSYNQFQQLLNYYHQADPKLEKKLLNDYNIRVQRGMQEQMGILQKQRGSNRLLEQSVQQTMKGSQIKSIKFQPNDVSKLPQLFSNKSSIRLSDVEPDLVANRYDKKITRSEFEQLKQDQFVSQKILNFFIRYLEEKQGSQKSQRIFLLTTTFFKQLQMNAPNKKQINYEAASFYTKQYTGNQNTIFDKFEQVLMPVAHNEKSYNLVLVNFPQKIITFYDCHLNGPGSQSIADGLAPQEGLMNIPSMIGIIRFLDQECQEKVYLSSMITKMMKNLGLFKYQLKLSSHQQVPDPRQSGLLASYLIYQISQGNFQQISSNQNELSKFHQNLCKLILSIGVTRNRKNEIDLKINQLPL